MCIYRLLPEAKIQRLEGNQEKDDGEWKKEKNARQYLAVGVNEVNRNIKKENLSSVILANDISPKFLVQHLHLLCYHHQVPFLQIPELREICKSTLGFPCIALGIKKNCNNFSEIATEVNSLVNNKNFVPTDNNIIMKPKNYDNQKEVEKPVNNDKLTDGDEVFQYLYRTNTRERIYVPETQLSTLNQKSDTTNDFISLGDNDTDNYAVSFPASGISCVNSIKKRKKLINRELESETSDNEEGLNSVPKKKLKAHWLIDKKGENKNYSKANVIKFQSNPFRKNKKNK